MTAHLIADPSAAATVLDPAADAGWLTLSAAVTDEVPGIADREDLLITIAPGAGRGAPACFLPSLATIEVDGTHLGIDPATAAPDRLSDRTRYPTAWGLLTHECAHARHSRWETPPGAPPGAVAAAELLEESRIEAAQVRRRPDDRHWLRASAVRLLLDDTGTSGADPAARPAMTPADAARAAALVLGRVDAGILTDAETSPLRHIVETILGAPTLRALRALWQAAHTVADDDAETMIDLGTRWCATLGLDPRVPEPGTHTPNPPHRGTAPHGPTAPGATALPTAGPAATVPDPSATTAAPATTAAEDPDAEPLTDGSGTREEAEPSALAQAIQQTCDTIAVKILTEPVPADPADAAAARRAAEHDARTTAQHTANTVFTHGVLRLGGPRSGRTKTAGTRPPSDTERAAARTLARALTTAGIRDRVPTRTSAALPPGRLRMRGALAADAQRAAGALPTAEPFVRTTRRPVPTPPLRIGIACDVSGSMDRFAAPVASAAWILAHSAHHAQVPATTATVIFGAHVRAVTAPGTTPLEVTEFAARDNYEAADTAIDALDGALDLARPDGARLLVIVSDGQFRPDPRRRAQARVDRLRAAGCGVLWLAPARSLNDPLHGVTVHTLDDPATTARAIGRAATTALRAH
ncbi:VWA domain-containing protein [Pseudonocardia sp.]|uniref:VWA domain-containing protein n=1 Tax=Pseudonocardia sp. TaxID=60912 RepID=UPI003D0C030B